MEDSLQPEEPSEEDCCHNDCVPCVFDIYRKQLEEWNKRKVLKRATLERHDLLSQTIFKPFRVMSILKISKKVWRFKFQPKIDEQENVILKSSNGVLPYEPGQHFVVRCYRSGNEYSAETKKNSYNIVEKLSRPYTIITNSKKEENCCFDVVIKLYENGLMSNYLKSLKVGEIAYWRGPYGEYSYTPNLYKRLIMCCMGTGIAPMYTIIKSVVENENDYTYVKLFFGIRKTDEIILRDELCNLAQFWNFSFIYFLSGEDAPKDQRYCETFKNGRISFEHLSTELTNKTDNTFVLVCGSENFNTNMKNCISLCQFPIENVHFF